MKLSKKGKMSRRPIKSHIIFGSLYTIHYFVAKIKILIVNMEKILFRGETTFYEAVCTLAIREQTLCRYGSRGKSYFLRPCISSLLQHHYRACEKDVHESLIYKEAF
jgi:hypothetical protein